MTARFPGLVAERLCGQGVIIVLYQDLGDLKVTQEVRNAIRAEKVTISFGMLVKGAVDFKGIMKADPTCHHVIEWKFLAIRFG